MFFTFYFASLSFSANLA